MLRSFLGGGGRKKDLERELRALEAEAGAAPTGSGGKFLNRAGDLCAQAGQRARALSYYGRAIDSYLEGGRFDAAGGVCRKLLRISPDAVRARCTLAWLAIGKGLAGDATREMTQYVRAASQAGQGKIARKQLHLMAQATPGPALHRLIAELLLELGDETGAERLLQAAGDGEGEEETLPADQEVHWARVLRAALMGPDELLLAPEDAEEE